MTNDRAIGRQILEGFPFDDRAEARCSSCWSALEGAQVIVCARRIYDAETWELNSIWCVEHAPDDAPGTPYGKSVLASARVGMLADVVEQRHDHALLDVVVEDVTVGEGPPPVPGDTDDPRVSSDD